MTAVARVEPEQACSQLLAFMDDEQGQLLLEALVNTMSDTLRARLLHATAQGMRLAIILKAQAGLSPPQVSLATPDSTLSSRSSENSFLDMVGL